MDYQHIITRSKDVVGKYRTRQLVFSFLASIFLLSFVSVFATDVLPSIDPMGLPFEKTGDAATVPLVKIIKEAIKYVGLIAIVAISWGGIQFLISMGNDEKVKHAKQTIIYSLVGVVLSILAYTIIDIVNSLKV